MFLSGVNKRKEYAFDKEKLIKSVNNMQIILNTYKFLNSSDDLSKYIISLELNEHKIRYVLGRYYSLSDKERGVPKYIEDMFNDKNNLETINILEPFRNIFYNDFLDFIKISIDFYKKAFNDDFSTYPYNLIKEDIKKIIIYNFNKSMFEY